MKPLINFDELEFEQVVHGERFEARDADFGQRIGARQLGFSLIVVPPGKRACPFHCHHTNEEAFVVLAGHGVVRIGKAEHPIRTGDVIAAPAGGPETAHQIINTSSEELRYLAVSTRHACEIVEYPDSSKISVAVDRTPGQAQRELALHWRGRLGPMLDYWDGE